MRRSPIGNALPALAGAIPPPRQRGSPERRSILPVLPVSTILDRLCIQPANLSSLVSSQRGTNSRFSAHVQDVFSRSGAPQHARNRRRASETGLRFGHRRMHRPSAGSMLQTYRRREQRPDALRLTACSSQAREHNLTRKPCLRRARRSNFMARPEVSCANVGGSLTYRRSRWLMSAGVLLNASCCRFSLFSNKCKVCVRSPADRHLSSEPE